MADLADIQFAWLTPDRWNDFEQLFGEKGACGGCWCMHWKLKHKVFTKTKGEGNKQLMKTAVEDGTEPGILVYLDDKPIAWCAVEPREKYPTLGRSKVLSPVDESNVWSVVCFYIEKEHRRKGLSSKVLEAVVELCGAKGAQILEGYPVSPKSGKTADAFAWTGLEKSYIKAGFNEVARRSETRPIMRYYISKSR